MEEDTSALPSMCSDDAMRVPWTAQLDVFEQDFDTAMAIWSVEDAVVGRLCADQPTMTRRRSHLSSSQVEFSQLSDCSQREDRPSRSKKRRRTASTVVGSQARDAPPPPLQHSGEVVEPSRDCGASPLLSMQNVDISSRDSQVAVTQKVEAQDIDEQASPARGAAHIIGSTPLKRDVTEEFRTPTIDRRVNKADTMSSEQASFFSESDVVVESPLDSPPVKRRGDSSIHHPKESDMCITSEFSTGSGKAVMVSRKRLREVEADWSAEERATKLDSVSNSHKMRTSSPQASRSGASSTPILNAQDSIAAIDPKRLSFSTMEDEVRDDPSCNIGVQTGSGRRLQLNLDNLRKYEALLFRDHVTHPNPNEESTLRDPTPLESSNLDSVGRSVNPAECAIQRQHVTSPNQDCGALDEVVGLGMALTGFQTGSGRTVAVSEERLHHYGNAVFAESDDHGSRQQFRSSDFDPAQEQPSQIVTALRSVPEVSALGFQTASGRTLAISEDRLREIEDRLFGEGQPSVSRKDLRETDVLQAHGDADSATVVSGFQTGSGSSVYISRDRLHEFERRALLDDSTSSEAADPTVDDTPSETVLAGFKTGSGGRVSVSKERLQKYEKLLNKEEDNELKSSTTSATTRDPALPAERFGGFVTARGKKVNVSEEKIREYARKLTDDDPVDAFARHNDQGAPSEVDLTSSIVGGFTTGTGRRVAISEEKLRQYEEKFTMSEASQGRFERTAASDCHDDDSDILTPRKVDATECTAVVLGGFTTGGGQCVSVSEKTLREYQLRALQSVDDDSSTCDRDDRIDLRDEKHRVKNDALLVKNDESSTRSSEGRPPRHRHSIGSLNTSIAVDPTNRRCSFPPKSQVKPADENSISAVSSGVIQRLNAAHQRNSRPLVLNDVSNIPKSRSRMGGLSGGGKWKPPSQLQGSQGGGYTTPAKSRAAGPQNLSAKKGFRPPVPSKAPPSKALMTTASTPPQKLVRVVDIPATLQISMRYCEAMRISYKLLAPETDFNSSSFTSVTRANVLQLISPELAPSLVFSGHDNDVLHLGESTDDAPMLDVMGEMKERDYIGADTAVTEDWFRNQYRWVVWKLAMMELQAPRFLFGRYLTRSQVMYEICKRYQRDVILAQRSILKKILNRDANAASCMILRVAAVLPFPVEEEKDVDIVLPPHWKLSVVLTDGWHGVYAIPDPHLAEALWKHHKANRLIGKKIVTWSASLQNINDGVDPLECALATEKKWSNPLSAGKEDPSRWPYLKLQSNSTRPVCVNTRLGLESLVRPAFGRQSDAPYDFVMLKSIPMRTLEVGGGIVRSACVRVVRISPILHLQSKDFSIGPRILCEEHMAQYFQARQEYQQSQRNGDAAGDDDSSAMLPLPVPFVKLEVECAHEADPRRKCYAVLTVWRPGDEMLAKIKEGGKYYVTSLSVNWKVDYGHQGVFMRVGTTKGSAFERADPAQEDHRSGSSRVCETIGALIERYKQHVTTMPKEKKLYGDVCVVIVRCEDAKRPIDRPPEANCATSTNHIFVTDTSGRLMSLRLHSMRVYKPSISACDETSSNSSSRKKASETVFTRGNKKLWSEGTVVCISGLEVSHFDDNLGVLDCELVESAQIVSLPSKKSHFYQAAQSLRDLLMCRDHAITEVQDMTRSIQALKKHVERTILRLEFEPSQEENDEGSNGGHGGDEAEFLTQELHAQGEDDVSNWMSQTPLIHIEGRVARLLPLDPKDPLSSACDVTAVAYVRSNSGEEMEGAVHAIYITKEILDRTHDLMSGSADPPRSFEANSDPVLRFEAQWETSERLLNSWKPWERDGGATFLLATSVSIGLMTEDS